MKKTTLMIAGLLFVTLLGSCSSSRKSGSAVGTSFVTITVGSNRTARLSVERATLFARLKNYLRGRFETQSAYAAIPSNVASIRFSAEAGDMSTITSTVSAAGLPFVTVTLEVPNGLNRKFVVTAFDASGNYAYWGRAFADLGGAAIILPVTMINLGSVSSIIWVSTGGSDATGDGTEAKPYRTITHALGTANPNTGILIEAGTYDAAGGEVYPITLIAGSALVCLGTNLTTVLDDTGTASATGAMITGAQNARIDGCKVVVSLVTPSSTLPWTAAVDDGGSVLSVNNSFVYSPVTSMICANSMNGITLSAANSSVAHTTIMGFYGCDGGAGDGIWAAANAVITGNTVSGNYEGIYVSNGNPIVSNNTVSGNSDGLNVINGSPVIIGNTITNNSNAGIISLSGSSTLAPSISNNMISGNYTGIGAYYAGTWNISGNTISNNVVTGIEIYGLSNIGGAVNGNVVRNNPVGITVTGAATGTYPPINNNSIMCNTTADLNSTVTTMLDATKNAWDHAPPSTSLAAANCPAGVDVCYSTTLPDVSSYTLVGSPCLP